MEYRKVKLNIPNLRDEYTIDTNGIVYNVTRNKYLKGTKITKNNRYTKIHLDKFYPLHKLVAQHFIENPNNYTEINHIDGNRYNNCADNLEWCTHRENIQHCWKNDLHIHQTGEINPAHKLTEKDVKIIWSLRFTKLTAKQIIKKLHLNVSTSCIKSIRQGKSWTSVTSKLR